MVRVVEHRRRNQILIAIILLGLANFLAYTFSYWLLQGDARNGAVIDGQYFLRGHFIQDRAGRTTDAVSRAAWIYSYLHSISIWPTIGAVLVSMLYLARSHIVATMSQDGRLRGGGFVTLGMILVVIITGAFTLHFGLSFYEALTLAAQGSDYGTIR